ncbi:alpha-(1,3)-fucosyltransferase C [Amyelois transitella]|uniref:alpha-(1,3)-fucosyltransferase C n=1 Tax=Amyelois transitella TaxID=680683 RepID=UPI00298FD644|nr:alpha-(1,3)-fucosyltransferase C [Amyelois transitella]
MKRNVVKIFVFIITLSLFLLWYNVYNTSKTKLTLQSLGIIKMIQKSNVTDSPRKLLILKYILIWTDPELVPVVYLNGGQTRFEQNKCPYTNCYATSNASFLQDYSQFDVVVFNGPEVISWPANMLPSKRSENQKYVFATIESSHNYPLCSNKFDGYFNWTWSYRLDSESRWGYIIVRNSMNRIIGPNKVMHWLKLGEMKPVSEEFKKSLRTKTKAAAWFVSNCLTRSKREYYVKSLKKELKKFNLTVDIYGECGFLSCSRSYDRICEEIVNTHYYFYLAFENSFSEDYVTEKLLIALQNNAIPVVYGGANYTRFMPDGIYLNARELGVEKLARKMDDLIRDPEMYAEFFKWKNHYTYHRKNENRETDDYCSICALLNNEEMMKKKSVYKRFRKWWDSSSTMCGS